jgi:hypothetical protein
MQRDWGMRLCAFLTPGIMPCTTMISLERSVCSRRLPQKYIHIEQPYQRLPQPTVTELLKVPNGKLWVESLVRLQGELYESVTEKGVES